MNTVKTYRLLLSFFGYTYLYFYYSSVRKFGFITVFSFGIDWNAKSNPLLFSQRIGITKYYEFLGWRFTFFKVKDI